MTDANETKDSFDVVLDDVQSNLIQQIKFKCSFPDCKQMLVVLKQSKTTTLVCCLGKCKKNFYCSEQCRQKDEYKHKRVCPLFLSVQSCRGFRLIFDGSSFAKSVLYNFGRSYLSRKWRGALIFRKFPIMKTDYLEAKLKLVRESGNKTNARVLQDPILKCVYYYFLLPIQSLTAEKPEEQDFDMKFVNLCNSEYIMDCAVPMIHMIFDNDDIENGQVKALSYYVFIKNGDSII